MQPTTTGKLATKLASLFKTRHQLALERLQAADVDLRRVDIPAILRTRLGRLPERKAA